METEYLRCERCETILSGDLVNTPEPVPCPGCRAPSLNRVFPAFFRDAAATARQETITSEEDASCFFHPRKKAVVPCASCGRFLCALCDLELEGRHLCPTCVENARGKSDATGKILTRGQLRYDYLALFITVFPFCWYIAPITAPVALYYCFRYWSLPKQSLVPRGHWRQVVAIILALAQLSSWILIVFFVVTRHR